MLEPGVFLFIPKTMIRKHTYNLIYSHRGPACT